MGSRYGGLKQLDGLGPNGETIMDYSIYDAIKAGFGKIVFIIRKDFEILKQFNFNAVRTSHYPPVNKYLELADEYGLFVIDEAGVEAHATEFVSKKPEIYGDV